MQLSETRFVKVEGTTVSATVTTAAEAKIAVKEIRQKKKEYAHIKKGLMRELKAAERIVNANNKKNKGKPRGLLSRVGAAMGSVAAFAGGYGIAQAKTDIPRLELECAQADEILHNLDTVLIQIEGKLLRMS